MPGRARCVPGWIWAPPTIVLAVVDEQKPAGGRASYPSTVVRDGIVVDYMGAVRAVTHLKGQLEERLGVMLDAGACAIPPGILEGNVKAIGNVVEAAGFRLTNIVDEPTAAPPCWVFPTARWWTWAAAPQASAS